MPHKMKDIMSADLGDIAGQHAPLLSEDPPEDLTSSDDQGWPLLKVVICANLLLLLISASVLAFGGLIHGRNNDESFLISAYGFNRYLDKGIQVVTGYGVETENPDWACLCEVIHSQFTSLHLKFSDVAFIPANMHGVANYLAKFVDVYQLSINSFKRLWIVDGSLAPKNGEMPKTTPRPHVSQMSSAILKREKRRSQILQKAKTVSFLKIVKDLSREGLLKSHQRVLCLDSSAGNKVRALKKKGFNNVEHIDFLLSSKASNKKAMDPLVEAFTDQTFDFIFTTVFDEITEPALFVAEIERILKVGGLAAMHVSLNAWHNKYMKTMPGDGSKPVTVLFTMSKIVYVSAAYSPGLDTVIVFRKLNYSETSGRIENIKGPGQDQVNGERVTALSEKVTNFSGSMTKYECRKCIKQQDVMFAPITTK